MFQTLYLKVYKYAISTNMFSYKILVIFQNNFSLKNFVRWPLDGGYLFSKNASKKYAQNFAKNLWLM